MNPSRAVGEDEASPYRGGITRFWLKVKVPGWTDPEDRWRRVLTARRVRGLPRNGQAAEELAEVAGVSAASFVEGCCSNSYIIGRSPA